MTEVILSFPTMDSSDSWTKVGRGGRHVEFPPEAAAAFGRRSGHGSGSGFQTRGAPYAERPARPTHAEFPPEAAAAFGRRGGGGGPVGERPERVSHYERPERPEYAGRPGRPEFPPEAASAFGKRGPGLESIPAFSKRPAGPPSNRVTFSAALAESLGLEDEVAPTWTNSAFAKKVAAAKAEAAKPPPPKVETYEEMFPTLGSAPPPKGKATAVALPTATKVVLAQKPAPAPPTVASGAADKKPSLAEILRKKQAEEEAAEAEAEKERARKAAEAEKYEIDRHMIVGHRYRGPTNVTFYDDEEEEMAHYGQHDDLDYDSYGGSTQGAAPKTTLHVEADEEAAIEEPAAEEMEEVW